MCSKQGPGARPLPTTDDEQDVAIVFALQGMGGCGGGRVTCHGGVDIRLVHLLPGKLAERNTFYHSFDMLAWLLKLEESFAGA